MLTIPIQVSGDAWNNRVEVEEILKTLNSNTSIMLDLCSEGPSLRRLGVIDLFEQFNFDVSITRWSNGVENVPFQRHFCNGQSHFYPMSRHYWIDEIKNNSAAEFKFGLFLGRNTYSRHRILYDAFHCWPGKFLLSKIPNSYGNSWNVNQYMMLETPGEWFKNVEQAQTWFENCPVPSLDNQVVQNYFTIPELSLGELTKSLLGHYPRFNIELVCETYTLGDTFFPTEKTTRPIVGNKPFIVYGPIGFLKNLRSTEGFLTFGDLWDESYDELEGPQRWESITQLIDYLSSLNELQWTNIIRRASEITAHNRNILEKIINDRKKL